MGGGHLKADGCTVALRWILSHEDTAGRRQCRAFPSTLEESRLRFVQALDRAKDAQTGVDKVGQARLASTSSRVEALSLPVLEIKPNAIETWASTNHSQPSQDIGDKRIDVQPGELVRASPIYRRKVRDPLPYTDLPDWIPHRYLYSKIRSNAINASS